MKNIILIILLLLPLTEVFTQSFYGKIEGCSGNSLENVKIEILSNSPVRPRPILDSILVGDKKSFSVSLAKPAFYLVRFNASQHESIEVPLLIYSKDNIELNIRLTGENNSDSNISTCQSLVTFTDDSTLTAFTYDLLNSFQPTLEDIVYNSSESDDIRTALAEWALVNLTKETDLERSEKLLRIFPPASYVWSISPGIFTKAISVFDKEVQLDYLQQIINSHEDETIKPYLYLVLFSIAKEINKGEIITEYYPIFESKYSESRYYNNAMSKFSPDRNIQKSNAVPDFRFVSVDDSSTVVTKNKMMGEIYLIDFWASWCLPCIKEMENLHKFYEEYNPKGLQIISISLDAKLEDAIKFRKNKWPMPWFNSFVEYKPDEKVIQDFELASIPKPILVNSDGKIIAEGKELLGENLRNILQSVFVED
jgi:thiol-disulfide isomerase/thioredoxin